MMAGSMSTALTSTRTRAASLPPDERRRTIVDAAIPLLVDLGELVTTRQIADAVGIAEGTLFRVFPDKDSILAAVVERILDPGPFEEAIAAIDPASSLEDVVAAAVEVAQRRSEHAWRVLSRLGHRGDDRKRRPMEDSKALIRLLEAHRDELAVAPRTAARHLRALTLAMSHPLLVERPANPREVAHVFLHGVGTADR
jgi:AcrR family transcriptional regulator